MIEGIRIQGIKSPFARGLVMDRGIHYMPHSLTPYAKNIRLRNGTTVRREGYTRVASGDAGVAVENLISVGGILYALTEGKLHKVNFQTLNLEKISEESLGEKAELLKYGDFILLLNGENEGKYFNTRNNTYKSIRIASGAKPRFGEVFEQNIFLAGSGENDNKLYKSRAGTKDHAENIFDFEGDGTDELSFRSKITGITGTREQLFVRTEDTIEIVQQSEFGGIKNIISTPIAGMNEPANHRMIVKADDKIFFWTKENMMKSLNYVQGVSESAVGDISHREDLSIKEFINALDEDQSTSFGYYHKQNKTVHWHLRQKGEPYTTVVLIYDLDTDSFLIDTNKYFTCVVNHKLGYYAGGANEQTIYQDEEGNADDGQPIQWERRSPQISLGSPMTRKEWRQINIYGEKEDEVSIKIEIIVDGRMVFAGGISALQGGIAGFTALPTATAPLGWEVQKGGIKPFEYAITRGNLRARGKDIQIVLKGDSFGAFCLTGMEIGYKDLGEGDKGDRAKNR